MDEFSSVQASPQVQFNQNPFFQSFLGKAVILLILIILTLTALNYFNILPLSKKPTQPSQTIKQNKVTTSLNAPGSSPSPIPTQLSLACSVASEFCKQGKLSTYQKNPALIYNLPAGSEIFPPVQISKKEDLLVLQNDISKIKTLYISAQDKDGCYNIVYNLPIDTEIQTTMTYPILIGQSITKLGKGSLIILVRTMPFDQDKLCTMWNNPLRESGQFLPLDKYISGLK